MEGPAIWRVQEPVFTAHLVNHGDSATTVVLPGDGSESGSRTPIVRWTPSFPSSGVRMCGNINALKAQEVQTLEPGERLKLDGWIGGPSIDRPGTYTVSLELRHIPDMNWSGIPIGDHDSGALQRIRESRPFTAKSNSIEVVVQ